jgi:parallel beta-helix repeat protein
MSDAFLLRSLPCGALACLIAAVGLRGQASAPVHVDPAGGEKAIHDALDGLPAPGGVVELGAGVFTVTAPIIIDRDDVELRGQGTKTQLVLAAGANCPMLVIGSVLKAPDHIVRRITVRRLDIDGNRVKQKFECWGGHCDGQDGTLRNNGITIRGAEDVVVEAVAIHGARSGGVVLEKYCRRVRVRGVEAHENEFDGMAAYETEDSEFSNLNFHHNRSAGFSFDWRFNRNRIADCNASDNGTQGIFIRDSVENVIERVTLRNNAQQGILMAERRPVPGTACRHNHFTGLIITGNRTQGIQINDATCKPNTLEDSLVKNNRLEDVSLAERGQLEIRRPRAE